MDSHRILVHNVIIGTMWTELFDETTIKNIKTGEKATLEWKKSGWLSHSYKHLVGTLFDSQGAPRIAVYGPYETFLHKKELDPKQELDWQLSQLKGKFDNNSSDTWWKFSREEPVTNQPATPYVKGWTKTTHQLLDLDPFLEETLPASDSRLRPDRLALQRGDITEAANFKTQLESAQRKRKDDPIRNKYFKLIKDENGEYWDYVGNYWEERAKRVELYEANHPRSEKRNKNHNL